MLPAVLVLAGALDGALGNWKVLSAGAEEDAGPDSPKDGVPLALPLVPLAAPAIAIWLKWA